MANRYLQASVGSVAIALSGVLGWLSGEFAISQAHNSFQLQHNGWLFSDTLGAPASSALERARIARSGPLALSSSEAVYFLTTEDRTGAPLNASCTYSVSGLDIDSQWWSVTLYDGITRNYVPSRNQRSSWTSMSVPMSDTGAWTIELSREGGSGTWLATPQTDDHPIELLLRVYNPSPETRERLPMIPLPVIERISC